jgi:hypothetical protein
MLYFAFVAEKKISNEIIADYQLIGIAASLREYKLCYHLNLLLGCDFRKLKDLIFEPTDRTRKVQFSVFKAVHENSKNEFVVFANKILGDVLLPEAGNFDFILQIKGKFEVDRLNELLKKIRTLPEVAATTVLPLKKIKSKERLVYEEEKPPRRLLQHKRKL